MRLLLDTHLLLWAVSEDDSALRRLVSAEGIALMKDTANELYFSAVSVWEVAIKQGTPRADFQVEPYSFRRTLLSEGYEETAITGEHGARVAELPPLHKDPFDRLLVAQAMVERMTLLTVDAALARYGGSVRRV